MLAGFDLKSATAADIAHQRLSFDRPWLLLHNIRTIASVVCLVLVLIGCIYRSEYLCAIFHI
jgi:hypothetical protein